MTGRKRREKIMPSLKASSSACARTPLGPKMVDNLKKMKDNLKKEDIQKIMKENIREMKFIWKFPLTPIGILAPGSTNAAPYAQSPIDMSRNFTPYISAESSSNISPYCLELISKVSKISNI